MSLSTVVHRCRFPDWRPRAIHAIAAQPGGALVAVGREDGDIELLVPSERYRVLKRVPGKHAKCLQALVWCAGAQKGSYRLIGAGLDGAVFEVDFTRLCYTKVRDSYGGAVWCMGLASTRPVIAIGCEDGSLKLFSVDGDELEYARTFPTTGARVLSLSWSSGDALLFAGGADSHIRCFNAKTGQSMYHMQVEAYGNVPTFVWALQSLADGTLISGSSLGHIQVWDSRTGTLRQSLATHEADVLALAASADQSTVFGTGVDNKVSAIQYIPGSLTGDTASHDSGSGRWVFSHSHRPHTHDVKALCCFTQSRSAFDSSSSSRSSSSREGDEVLLSGGIDTKLCKYGVRDFKGKATVKMGPFPYHQVAFVAKAPRLLLVAHSAHLDLWQLPAAAALTSAQQDKLISESVDGDRVPTDGAAVIKLLQIKLRGGHHISCAAFSADGRYAAASNAAGIKVFAITETGTTAAGAPIPPVASRLSVPSELAATVAQRLAFTPDGRRLIAATAHGRVTVLQLPATDMDTATAAAVSAAAAVGSSSSSSGDSKRGKAMHVHTFAQPPAGSRLLSRRTTAAGGGVDSSAGSSSSSSSSTKRVYLDDNEDECDSPVTGMCVSADGQWLALCTAAGAVHTYSLDTLKHHWRVPPTAEGHLPTGVTFHGRTATLVLLTAGNGVSLVDVEEKRSVEWTRDLGSSLPAGLYQAAHAPFLSATVNPAQTSTLLVYNHDALCHIDLNKPVPAHVTTHRTAAASQGLARHHSSRDHGKKARTAARSGKTDSAAADSSMRSSEVTATATAPADDEGNNSKKKRKRSAAAAATAGAVSAEFTDVSTADDGDSSGPAAAAAAAADTKALVAAAPAAAVRNGNFTLCMRFRPMLHVEYIGPNELVIVEAPWSKIVESLPDTLYRQRYGT